MYIYIKLIINIRLIFEFFSNFEKPFSILNSFSYSSQHFNKYRYGYFYSLIDVEEMMTIVKMMATSEI